MSDQEVTERRPLVVDDGDGTEFRGPNPEVSATDQKVQEQVKDLKKVLPRPLQIPKADGGDVPPWADVPQGMRVPKGRQVIFIRFPSAWTDDPGAGKVLRVEDAEAVRIAGAGALWRQCIVWALDVPDNKAAVSRAGGDVLRLSEEMTLGMIRSVDGARANWSGEPGEGSMDLFWNQIGARNRNLLQRVWQQLHTHDSEQLRDFFESCVAVRQPGA